MCNCKIPTKACFEFEMLVWCEALSHTEMWWWREDVIRGIQGVS